MKKPRNEEERDTDARPDEASEREQDPEREEFATETGQVEDASPGSLAGEEGAAPGGESETEGTGDVCKVTHVLDRKTDRVKLVLGAGCTSKDLLKILDPNTVIEDLQIPGDPDEEEVEENEDKDSELDEEEDYEEIEDNEDEDDEPEGEDQDISEVEPDAKKTRAKR